MTVMDAAIIRLRDQGRCYLVEGSIPSDAGATSFSIAVFDERRLWPGLSMRRRRDRHGPLAAI
jgi:hypothetical protein